MFSLKNAPSSNIPHRVLYRRHNDYLYFKETRLFFPYITCVREPEGLLILEDTNFLFLLEGIIHIGDMVDYKKKKYIIEES